MSYHHHHHQYPPPPCVEEEYHHHQYPPPPCVEEEYHHHHHHYQPPPPPPCMEEEYCSEALEGERLYAPPRPAGYPGTYEQVNSSYYDRSPGGYVNPNSGRNHQRNERLGELGAVAAGAFALYEGNKIKKDPENASRHKIEAGTAALGALGSAGYAYYEHRQKERF